MIAASTAESALRYAKAALKAGGGTRARLVAGNASFRLRNFGRAISLYEAVLAKHPKNAEALRALEAAKAQARKLNPPPPKRANKH